MTEYPQRCSFFAHKFVRLLHKAAVASEVGRDAFALLVVVVHTEDAMRYRGAAKFWNSQLIETLGFKKWDQFDAARRKTIDSGWLVYTCHGKRMAGEYFVTIPDGYEMIDDTPIEPESYPKNGYDVGYKDGYDRGIIEGMNRVRSGVRTGDEQGEPSIPIPNPNPIPVFSSEPSAEVSEPELGSGIKMPVVGTNAKDYDIPQSKISEWSQAFPGIDVPTQCRKAAQWCRDNPTKRKTLKGVNRFLNTWLSKEQDTPRLSGHAKTNGHYPKDLLKICTVCKQHPQEPAKRREILGPKLHEISRRLDVQTILSSIGDDWKMKSLNQFYGQHLKDLECKAT